MEKRIKFKLGIRWKHDGFECRMQTSALVPLESDNILFFIFYFLFLYKIEILL